MISDKHKSAVTFSEIYSQAASAELTLQRSEARLGLMAELLPLDQYTDIILTGCGSSYNLAKCASYAWSQMTGRLIRAVPSSELMAFPQMHVRAGARPLIVAISRTGGTTEVQLAVERMQKDYGARSVAITGQPDSPVGASCNVEVAFTECHEESIVMTQAFTCMLMGLYLLADGSAEWRHGRALSAVPGLIAASIERHDDALRGIAEDPMVSEFFFLGSGVMKGLADESALKMTEMALSNASAHRSLEFRHGPKAALDDRSLVILFPVVAERPHMDTLLDEIHQTGARMIIVGTPIDGLGDFSPIVLGSELPEFFRPALFAHVGQLLACWRAASRGLDPSSPRNLARTVLLDV